MNEVGGQQNKNMTKTKEGKHPPIALTQPIPRHSNSNLIVLPTRYKRALKVVNAKERETANGKAAGKNDQKRLLTTSG